MALHPDMVLKSRTAKGINKLLDGEQLNIQTCRICLDEADDAIQSKCRHVCIAAVCLLVIYCLFGMTQKRCTVCATELIEATELPECVVCHLPLSIDLEQPAMQPEAAAKSRQGILDRIDPEENGVLPPKSKLSSRNLPNLAPTIIPSNLSSSLRSVRMRLWSLHSRTWFSIFQQFTSFRVLKDSTRCSSPRLIESPFQLISLRVVYNWLDLKNCSTSRKYDTWGARSYHQVRSTSFSLATWSDGWMPQRYFTTNVDCTVFPPVSEGGRGKGHRWTVSEHLFIDSSLNARWPLKFSWSVGFDQLDPGSTWRLIAWRPITYRSRVYVMVGPPLQFLVTSH